MIHASSYVYNKDVYPDRYEDYPMKRKGISIAFDKTQLRRQNNHILLPSSSLNYKFCTQSLSNSTQSGCTSQSVSQVKGVDFAVVSAYIFYHGKDTVYVTAGDNISDALADSVYNDILLSRLNAL